MQHKRIPDFPRVLSVAALVGAFWGLAGCERQNVLTLEEGKRYYLREMPDSAYVASLEEFADTANKVEMEKWQSGGDVVLKTGLLPGKVGPEEFEKMFGKRPGTSESSAANQGGTEDGTTNRDGATGQSNSESFLEGFQKAVDNLRQNPESSRYGQKVTAPAGGFGALLQRQYGSNASFLPEVTTRYQIQALNPELDLNNLSSGQRVLLPRVR